MHEIARKIKNKVGLFLNCQQFLIPQNLDANLRPDEDWLMSLCNQFELLSFTHKKNAVEQIKEKIDSEIERKKMYF
jgi:hypothetical protein